MKSEKVDITTVEGAQELVVRARKFIKKFLPKIERITGVRRREYMADQLLKWILSTSSGYLASDALEKIYLDIASRIHCELPVEHERGTCLVVMTHVYISGGHTRWVEQWIECDTKTKYSLVLTEPICEDLPSKLIQQIVERGGRIYCLGGNDRMTVAKNLRKLGSGFEFVIVSSHMGDVVPVLAFGTEDFKRPIALMNHANHMFWIGMSIADRIIDCGVWQQKLSLECRGADKTYILPWLSFDSPQRLDLTRCRKQSRVNLGISPDKFIILTAAGTYKYDPVAGYDYTEFVDKLLSQCREVEFYCIGVEPETRPSWKCLQNEYGPRLHFHPVVPLEELKSYCYAADLYIDSFPFTSGGTVGVARLCGCPALTLCSEFNYPDWMRCKGVEGLLSRTEEVIRDPRKLRELQVLTETLQETNEMLGARANCEPQEVKFIEELREMKHGIRNFVPKVPEITMNDYTILATRYRKEENDTAESNLRVASIGSEWFGMGLVSLFGISKRVMARAGRILSGK